MKRHLTLGPAGIKALVTLCAHVEGNGSFAVDGKWLARALIVYAGGRDDVARWSAEDLAAGHSKRDGNRLRRLADSKIELSVSQEEEDDS